MLACITWFPSFRIKTLITCQEFWMWAPTYVSLTAGKSCLQPKPKPHPHPKDRGSQDGQSRAPGFPFASSLDLSRSFLLQRNPRGLAVAPVANALQFNFSLCSLYALTDVSESTPSKPQACIYLHLRLISQEPNMAAQFLKSRIFWVIFHAYS